MAEYRLTDRGRAKVKERIAAFAEWLAEGATIERDQHGGVQFCGSTLATVDDWFEPVPPPLPAEPPGFSTVRVGRRAYVRDDMGNDGLNWYGPQGRKSWAEVCREAVGSTGFPPVLLVPVPEPVELPERIHDVVAFAIARAEKEPCASGHYVLAEHVVEELRVRGWLSAADEAEREQ